MNFFKNILNGISRFLSVMVKSCYDMEFYRSVRTVPLSSAIKYAVALHFFLMLVVSAILFPMTLGAKARLVEHVDKTIPANASITLAKGQMSTTLSVPYDLGNDQFHVVIDPTHEGQNFPEQLKDPGVRIGRDAVFMRRSANETRTYDLKGMPDTTFTKETFEGWLTKYAPPIIAAGLAMFALLYWILFLGSTMLTVALYSVMSMLFGQLFRAKLRYGQWYAIGLHAVTLPILVGGMFTLLRLQVSYAYTFIFFMIIAAVITDEKSNPVDGHKVEDEKVPMPTGKDDSSDESTDDEKSEDAENKAEEKPSDEPPTSNPEPPAKE